MLEVLASKSELSILETNNLSVLMNTAGWNYNAQEGWFKNDFNWSTRYPLVLPNIDVSRIRKLEVTITGYYDIPAKCIGASMVELAHTGSGTVLAIGTGDAWDDPNIGQDILRGDLPVQSKAIRNAINETYQITVPKGQKATSLTIRSAGYSGGGVNYAHSRRGIKNFKFWYE